MTKKRNKPAVNPTQAATILSIIRGAGGKRVKKAALQQATGLEERCVRLAIKFLRDTERYPVLSENHPAGYWFAQTREEVQRFQASMRHRAEETMETVRACDDILRDWDWTPPDGGIQGKLF